MFVLDSLAATCIAIIALAVDLRLACAIPKNRASELTVRHALMQKPYAANAMIDCAVHCGVKHIVYVGSWTSALEYHTPTVIGKRFRPTESLLSAYAAEKKISFTSLRAGFFHENFLNAWKNGIKESNSVYWPVSFAIPSVDPRDVGSVAAVIAATPDYAAEYGGKYMHVSGPQRHFGKELVDFINKASGTTVQYCTPSSTKDYLSKIPSALAELLTAYDVDHDSIPLSDTVQRVTGRPGRNFEEWLQENKYRLD